jgi:hypothetical protein
MKDIVDAAGSRGKGATMERIEIHSGPDRLGRHTWTGYWAVTYTPGHPDGEHVPRERGRVFFCRLPSGEPKAALARAEGRHGQ